MMSEGQETGARAQVTAQPMIKTEAFGGSSIQKKGRQRTGLEDLVARVCAHSCHGSHILRETSTSQE